MILPDTSVWIPFFRPGPGRTAHHLAGLIEDRLVLGCGPVLAEILAGTPSDRRNDIWTAYDRLPWADMGRPTWRLAGEVAFGLGPLGLPLPLADVSIAAAAVHEGAQLWTLHRDFNRIRDVLPALELYEPVSN